VAAASVRHPRLLDRDAAVLVVVDVQEAYRPALFEYERLARAVAVIVHMRSPNKGWQCCRAF